jgi:pyruvate formate lyase activating enzyme
MDPVEKKPLNHFLPGSPILSFGTAGCNLSCKFCQNWDISKAREDNILSNCATPVSIAERAVELGAQSVAFTYNEPIIFMEYAVEAARECHKRNIKTVAVTNGYICEEPRKEFFGAMDATNVDLKGFSEKFYKNITGATLKPVLDTLIYVKHETKVWLEITTLLITGLNDSDEELKGEIDWIIKNLGVDVPIHFTAFYPAWKMLNHPPTPVETLIRARNLALEKGIRYVYTGNVYNPEGSNTYCHNCKKIVIGRDGYKITTYELTEQGKCKFCGTLCSGIFTNKAGRWDGQRKPLYFGD